MNYYSLPDMAEAHRQSFFRFLNHNLKEELEQIFPLYLQKGRIQVILHSKSLHFEAPDLSLKNAFIQRTSYSISIYFLVTFIDWEKNSSRTERLCFGSVPLCTSGGWFLVRGLRRIILHQLVRSAGCYASVFNETKNLIEEKDRESLKPSEHIGLTTFQKSEVLILPQQGPWLRFFLDSTGVFSIQWGKTKDQCGSAFLFLRAMGISSRRISDLLNVNSFEFPYISSNQATFELGFHSKKGLSSRRAFYQRFFNSTNYTLGEVGRFRLNRRFNLSIPLENQYLCAEDIFSIFNYLAALSIGLKQSDDIDNLENKRLKSCGDFLTGAFQTGLKIGLKNLKTNLENSISPTTTSENGLSTFWGVENTHFCSTIFQQSFQDLKSPVFREKNRSNSRIFNNKQNNTLNNFKEYRLNLSISYRITSAFHSFFATSAVSQPTHQTNPIDALTHARRCTSLGPGGLTREHAGIAVRGIHPSHFGRLCPVETPEGQNTGLVNSPSFSTRVNLYGFFETPYWPINSQQVIKDQGAIYLSPNQETQLWVMPNESLVSKSGYLSKSSLLSRSGNDFAYLPPTEINYLGVLPNQMFSLGASLIPFMEHDDGNRALMGSNMQRQAVPLLNNERPLVGTGLESVVGSDTRVGVRSIASGYIYYVSGKKILVHSLIHWRRSKMVFETIEYQLGRYESSNQGTCIDQKPIVNEGDWIKAGDLLAEGYATKGGELSLGRNLCVAYLPWEGYNYEDAVLINESLVYQDVLTSIHIEKYETELSIRRIGKKQIQEKLSGECSPSHPIPGATQEQLAKLNEEGIIREGVWVESNDILVGKLIPSQVELRPEERLVHAIFGTKPPAYQDASFRLPKYVEGRVIRVERFKNKNMENTIFRIFIAQQRRIQVGDKIAGRHGNKGVISRILPRQDMPYLQNGLDVDIVLNPLGIPSRMNVGQVYEGLLGLASRYVGRCFRVLPFDEGFGCETSRGIVYSQLAQARKQTGQTWLFDPQSSGKSRVFDGRTGDVFEQSILVTQSYILKLEHQVDEKIHARSTGPYSLITQQPVRGRSRQGGQRLGEMEVWAIEGYGAAYLLYEMLSIKADDLVGRQQAATEILRRHYGPTPISAQRDTRPESFQVLASELRALCLDFQYPL
uniref:DNA-directed RNA polymerase subunit beta n=1 Tax=Chloropicon maureeniae TaxID=1461542 RepID=A0A4D6C5Q7_9CHLO|nr:beta subunit of RNA polymerase [Chloropicon maureeniae]QBX98213.1 beta subunit of RNA polymerase [Chloropicon maureeniae]